MLTAGLDTGFNNFTETVADENSSGTAELPPIPEEDLFEGGWELEDIPGLDLVIDSGEELPRLYSTVLDFTQGDILLLRPGAGPWPV
jgi:hypothetical protein